MSGITDFATSAQDLSAALAATAIDPNDAVNLLASLADFTPADPTSTSGVGDAMATMQNACGQLFRRSALISLCEASTSYQASSADDALALRERICALLDAEIAIAGDQGADSTFNALRSLRTAVVQDLTARGADLTALTTVVSPNSVPAPVLAQRLYRDGSRADELVAQANVIHPAFMPTNFKARAK